MAILQYFDVSILIYGRIHFRFGLVLVDKMVCGFANVAVCGLPFFAKVYCFTAFAQQYVAFIGDLPSL